MGKRLGVVFVLVIAFAVGATAVGAGAPGAAKAEFTYQKCGAFRYKGRHLLFTHRYPCQKAKRKAKYVLRHRHRPPHWTCSLSELSSGFAACHRGRRAWEFVPR
jgi:hypothetical protein